MNATDHWRSRGICVVEAGAPEMWTKNPRAHVTRREMESMCRRCPIFERCAQDAVANEYDLGFYAGVWVPSWKDRKGWKLAMDRLRRVAGMASARTNRDQIKAPAA